MFWSFSLWNTSLNISVNSFKCISCVRVPKSLTKRIKENKQRTEWTYLINQVMEQIESRTQWEFPQKRKSVINDEKKFSGKNFFGHILGYFALYLSAKNQKKLMKKFCTKSKKPYFWAVFGPNLPKKIFFRKSGSVTFWALPFCTFVPKIRKN